MAERAIKADTQFKPPLFYFRGPKGTRVQQLMELS